MEVVMTYFKEPGKAEENHKITRPYSNQVP